jgi:DNA-binding NarL/FixJ family response regulator
MITVVLCDDQALIRTGLRMILSSYQDIEIVGEAVDGNEAITTVRTLDPDVVLMDIRMPGIDGIEATKRISADPTMRARVVMLTTFNEDEYLYEALQAGAAGFLLKTCPADQLVHAVRQTAAGEIPLAPEITQQLVEDYLKRSHHTPDKRLQNLTERELEVLRLIASGHPNADIASALFLGEATVKTHINRIFSKLGVRDRTQAVIAAFESGLVLVPTRTRPTRQ